MSWIAIEPSPPEAPQTSTLWPGRRMCGAVAEQHAVGGGERQRVAGALLPGQVQGRGMSWRACTRQNWAKEPSGVS